MNRFENKLTFLETVVSISYDNLVDEEYFYINDWFDYETAWHYDTIRDDKVKYDIIQQYAKEKLIIEELEHKLYIKEEFMLKDNDIKETFILYKGNIYHI